MKSILGLNHGEINSSACIVQGGKVVAGCPEERFNRQKLTKNFPHQAVDYCLHAAGITLNECEAVAQGWNPGALWIKHNPLVPLTRSGGKSYLYSVPDNLYHHAERRPGDWLMLDGSTGLPPIYFVNHHRCHAANGFFLSSFDEAAILTCDWKGELECTSFVHGRGLDLEVLQTQFEPNALGLFYSTFTQLLGYKPDNDEWKVMALSALDANNEGRNVLEKLKTTYRLHDDGSLELDQSYYQGGLLDRPKLYSQKLVELLGSRVGVHGEVPDDWHIRVASGLQAASGEIAGHFLCHLYRLTKCHSLVLSGGFFMNSVFNGKVLDRTPFNELYVPYAPTDAGNSIGAAMYTSHCILRQAREHEFSESQIGPSFNREDARAALERRSIPYRLLSNPPRETAELLTKYKVVAVFEGASEFGDRALGHRSILGDPREAVVKDHINAAIKYREAYRPFAPATLEDRVGEIFEIEEGFTCPYMEKVVPIRSNWRLRIPAVTHTDGSGRVQTVSNDVSPHFYQIIKEFDRLTNIPVVLNTSFNLNGEPIVLTPDDALNSFFNSGLRHLVLNGLLIEK